MAYLRIMNLTKVFGEVRAVSNANIEIEKGEFFTFLGPSGCGKTTTLRMIAGFETPTEGKIIMDDKDITYLPPEAKEIGMMFQNYALFPHMTVAENVAYGLKIKKLPKAKIGEQVEHYLTMVGLKGYGKRKINQLSGGEQQRVALARSLAIEPKILLLDEPLSNLDAKMRDEMRFELKRLQHDLKITMLYVTHDQNEALMMSDHIAVFSKGKIQQIGTPSEVYTRPSNSFVADFVGQTNLVEVTPQGSDCVITKDGTTLQVAQHNGKAKYASIRNEHIHMMYPTAAASGVNTLAALVTSAQYNGMITYYTVKVKDTELNVTATNNGITPIFHVGESVAVKIEPETIALLEV